MNSTTFVGNLTSDPELRFSSDNKPRATFTVAVNEGQGDDEKTHFIGVTAFGTLGENLVDSLHKGQRVIVTGRVNTYKKPVQLDGKDVDLTMVGFTASAIGPDLRWAIAKVSKVVREKDDSGNGSGRDSGHAERSAASERGSGSRSASASSARSRTSPAQDSDDF